MCIVRKWGWPRVDLFASEDTVQEGPNGRRLEYYSRMPDPKARGCDAMVQNWEDAYGFPPLHLAWAAVDKALKSRGVTILVLPAWRAQPWWPLLLENCGEEDVLELGTVEDTCVGGIESNVGVRETVLRAWRIRGNG